MPERVPSLDGLRALSVGMVFLGHLALVGAAPAFLVQCARFGVEAFFVISGFIITRLLLREMDSRGSISLGAFYKRRFFRIVPAAYLYIGVAVAVHVAQFRAIDLVSVLTFTANYDLHKPDVVGHLWSLGIEEQFYILWPLVLTLFFRRRVEILLGALCAAPFIVLGFRLAGWGPLVGFAFPTSYDTLALGCLGAVLYDKLAWLQSRWFLVAAPMALLSQWPFWKLPFLGSGHTLWPLTHLCIGILVLHCTRHSYLVLNAAPLVWIGSISYGLYLWQPLFLLGSQPRLAPVWTAIAACLSYYLMERPILRTRLHPESRAPELAKGARGEGPAPAAATREP